MENKLCPMGFTLDKWHYCRENCAWYDTEHKQCGVVFALKIICNPAITLKGEDYANLQSIQGW